MNFNEYLRRYSTPRLYTVYLIFVEIYTVLKINENNRSEDSPLSPTDVCSSANDSTCCTDNNEVLLDNNLFNNTAEKCQQQGNRYYPIQVILFIVLSQTETRTLSKTDDRSLSGAATERGPA